MNKKITILSLSLITVLAGGAVSPALGAISGYFGDSDPLLIGLIVSLPALFTAITSMFSSNILKVLTMKRAGIMGVVLYLIGGLCGAFSNTIYTLLFFRAVLGIGTGIILPLSTGLIAYFYDAREQGKLMGYSAACNNLGGIISLIFSGLLISISWRMAFSVYLIALVPLVLILAFLPNEYIKSGDNSSNKDTLKIIRPYLIMMFLMMLTFYVFIANFSRIMFVENFINVKYIGIVMSGNTILAFIIGIYFSSIVGIFKDKIKYIGACSYLVGFLMLFVGQNMISMLMASILIGIGIGTIMPLVNSKLAKVVDKKEVPYAMAMNGFVMFIAQFLSPFFISFLTLISKPENIRFPFLIGMMLSFVLIISIRKVDLEI